MTASWRRILWHGRWCRVREWRLPVDDIDVWPMASLLMSTHGDGAANHALQRATELLRAGDIEGHAVWARVVPAIARLQQMTPDDGVMH